MMWGEYGGMGWSWIIGLVLVIAVVIVAVVLIVRLVPGERRPQDSVGTAVSEARRILDERYARGELTTAEYEERVVALQKR